MNKILLKYFILFSLILLVIFNWGYVSWFFHYQTIRENLAYLARKILGQYDLSINITQPLFTASSFTTSSLPNASSSATAFVVEQKKPVMQGSGVNAVPNKNVQNYLSIPKIGVQAPILFTQSRSQKIFNKLLSLGVLHYPDSALPGSNGTTIVLGHSAPPNWPKIHYDSVFNNLQNLKPGDEIFINFQGKKYKYATTNTFFVKKGQDISPYLTFEKNMLLLISCWPPGHNLQRIVVRAQLTQ